jgi:HK97 family phage portal protein
MNASDYQSEIVAGVHVLDSQRRSLENPNLPLNSPAIWEEVFGESYNAETGESVTAQKALMYGPLWHAVQMISGDIAKLPLHLYIRRPELGDDARERDRSHPLNRVLGIAANEETESIKFWGRFMAHALLWGNGYAYIERDGAGQVTGLYNLLPDRTNAERINGKLYYVTETGDNGRLQVLLPEEVLHIEGLSVGTLGGMTVFRMARNAIGLGLAQEKFAAKFFRHGGRVGGILELPMGLNKTARDTVEEGFRKSYEGAENPFKTVILRDNAKFHEAQQSPRESQMVEATEAQTRQIAHWFNLMPSKLGLSDSVSYNSKAEDNQAYLDTTLNIWLVRICAACNFRLLSIEDQSTYFVEHNTSGLLRMDLLAQAQAFQILVAARVMNPNECRAKLNMLPYEGGEQFVNPNTMTSGAPETEDDPGDSEETPDEEEEQPEDEPVRSVEYTRMLFAITAKAREKAKSGGVSMKRWIDGNLAAHRKEYQGKQPFPFDEIAEFWRTKYDLWKARTINQVPLAVAAEEWCKELELKGT